MSVLRRATQREAAKTMRQMQICLVRFYIYLFEYYFRGYEIIYKIIICKL